MAPAGSPGLGLPGSGGSGRDSTESAVGRGDQILVPGDSDVQTVADLAGRKVLVAKGTSAHGHLLLQLRKAGVDPESVELVFLQPAEASNGFWFGVASHEALADPRRQTAIADLLVRIAEAWTWTAQNPAEWASYYGEAVGLTPEAAELSQGRSTRGPVELADDRFVDDLASVVGPLP